MKNSNNMFFLFSSKSTNDYPIIKIGLNIFRPKEIVSENNYEYDTVNIEIVTSEHNYLNYDEVPQKIASQVFDMIWDINSNSRIDLTEQLEEYQIISTSLGNEEEDYYEE